MPVFSHLLQKPVIGCETAFMNFCEIGYLEWISKSTVSSVLKYCIHILLHKERNIAIVIVLSYRIRRWFYSCSEKLFHSDYFFLWGKKSIPNVGQQYVLGRFPNQQIVRGSVLLCT